MIADVEAALSEYRLGEPSDVTPRSWPELASDLEDLQGLPQLAAFHAQTVADALRGPEWADLAAWLRAHALGGPDRPHQLRVSLRAADALQGELDDPAVAQVYGMLHLNCALAAAATRDEGTAEAHLREAEDVAAGLADEVGTFGTLYFGRANVGIWRVSLSTELGHGGKVAEVARHVQAAAVPSAARQAMFYADLGRALAESRKTQEAATQALRRAESIAPQRIRTNSLVRATVAGLAARAKRDSVGRDLRGMAYRMGVPV
ncbi:hypothetical protein [Solihabitans fulvus]|uniref:hypothetical protein n=1 Tax=Solihabitans fulvus TaxID=1892852 RepID=UPI001CB76578|nr:hypothetical protein [Solihabitans fulvus]